MFGNLDADRFIIENKYHDTSKAFDFMARMAHHGTWEYDSATGIDDQKIHEGLTKLEAQLEGLSHPVIKATMVKYVLENTMIAINEHDYFFGMYTWNRPVNKHCINKWHDEIQSEALSLYEDTRAFYEYKTSGAINGLLDFDHTVPDWDSLMELGFTGVLERATASYEKLKAGGTLTDKQEEFYKGIKIAYTGVIDFIKRLYELSLTKTFPKAKRIQKCLKNLSEGAPQTTFDALQLIYLYFMVSESIDSYQVRSLGYGFDRTLYPFYKNDLAKGTFTEQDIQEFIAYFLMQFSAIGNYWGQPVYLGGTDIYGNTLVNELSYSILDIYDKLGIFNPKIQIKYSKNSPPDFYDKALEMIRHGVSSIVFINEDIIVKSLMAGGATYEEAVDSAISGCYEYKVKAKGIEISSVYYNLLKPIEYVFSNGYDKVMGKQLGAKTGVLSELVTFKDFYTAYIAQLKHLTNIALDGIFHLEQRVQHINPSCLFSATIPDCVNTLTDALDNGIQNITGGLINGLATASDALMAVRELVYEKKEATLEELSAALDANWAGYEALRAKALACPHKYGRGDKMADSYVDAINRIFSQVVGDRKNGHGGQVHYEIHSARQFIELGKKTGATPDGRFAGEEISKNASPSIGADTNGITALISSVTNLDCALSQSGCGFDAMLHPSAVQGKEGLIAFRSVLDTYMAKGGASIHFNIFNADILRDAQAHPEKYKTLQVRVCGWNILWNNMNKAEQDMYIKRAETIV